MESLTKKLHKKVWNAIKDFNMIEKGDRIMVCISGGKDSYTMLDMLMHIQKTRVYDFEIVAVNMDQKQPGFPEDILPKYFSDLGVDYKIIERDTYPIVVDKTPQGKTMCSLCSRLRRGTLYTAADDLGCNKLALGHHREDIIETLFLNLMFSGKLEAMPAKYRTDDGKHVVLRPLAYCKENDIEQYAEHRKFPIIPCNLCGSQEGLQRQRIKNMLAEWEQQHPGRKEVIFNAIKNVSPSHLMDHDIYDFHNLEEKVINNLENNEVSPISA
ncbi:MAG: tRNA 2-thiocytidine(32) synthetase TtcA [Flavobacteriales bacterium]|nr:tRNA 2-thiocytidine(32) synthetase TtcA [Flavobacteriales bacterium]